MNAKEIMDKKFDKSFNGYKMDDVDEFLRDISIEFTQLQKENSDLEKKLEVLADKIREYREDEDALKDALLSAQKQSKELLAETQAKTDKLLSDAKEKAAKIVKDAEDGIVSKKEEAKKIIDNANAEKNRIINEAKSKADEMHSEMLRQNERDTEILARTRDESKKFTALVLAAYEKHIEEIKAIPSKYENDFVKNAKAAPQPTKAPEPPKPVPAAEQPKPQAEPAKPVEEPKTEPEAPKAESEAPKSEEIETVKAEALVGATTEIGFQPVFEEEDEDEEVEDFSENKHEGLFFEKPQKTVHEKLEFGKNK
ncbi:MAG: DivIVA domain-containing protein [Ruminiclostridium sp.]